MKKYQSPTLIVFEVETSQIMANSLPTGGYTDEVLAPSRRSNEFYEGRNSKESDWNEYLK